MAKKKDKTRDGQKLGPAYHIKVDRSYTGALDNKGFGMMARNDKQADKNTVLSSPINHLRKETPTSTQMYSGKGKNKVKTVQSSWNRNGGKSGNNGSKSGKSGNQPKPMNRDARIMSATLSDSHKRPAIMATDQAKRELEADNDRNNSPMGTLRRRARKAQTGQADNYSREEADKRLFSETLSSARKAEKNYKKTFEENRYTGGSKTLLSGADTKNLSEEEQNNVQVWKDEWDKGQRLIDQGYTQKGKQMQAEAHAQAERIRMTEGYSGGESGSDFTTPEMKPDEYAVMSDAGRKNIRVAKSLYEFGQKTGDEELMKQAAQMGQDVRLTPGSYDYERSEAYHRFAKDRPVENPNTDAYGRSIYTPNEWEQEQNKKWGTAVGQGLKGGFLTLLETARKATQNAVANRYDPEYQSKKYTAEYLQHEANKEQDEREKIRLNAKAAKMLGEANDAKAKENIGTDTPGMQALRASSDAAEDLVNNAKTRGGKLLTKAGISMLQMAPFLAANVIPGAGQAISLGGMGALAAGQKAGELQQDNRVSAQEAFARGLVSGGIEAFTEKIPMDSLLKLVKGGGGTNFIKAVAKQAGIEATEESASYTMNWLADKAARDPKAKFSLSDLAENAAIGAISGGVFGAGGHVIGSAMTAGRTPYKQTSPIEDTTPTPTVEEVPRPIQEPPTQESANPLIRASQAQEQMRTQAQEQAQANQDTRAQMQSAKERLAAAQQDYQQRVRDWQERAQRASTQEEVADLMAEKQDLEYENNQLRGEQTHLEREEAGQLSKNIGEESAHIDRRTAQDVSKPSVKAFQWDYPQMHQYYAQAAEALLQDVEYSKAGQFNEKGRGTVVTKSEAMMQAERMGISRTDLEKALTAIINDQGQENYATAKKVELVLDEMLSKGYIPNEAGYSANKVDSQVPPNEAYIMAKEAIPGAVKRGSFEAYKEQNRLALELGEVTEDQLYQEWQRSQDNPFGPLSKTPDAQSQAQFDAQTQDTQVQPQAQQNPNEIPETFDEYKEQFRDVIDSREMTEGQLLDEYNAVRRRNERLQRRGEPIRRTRIEPQYTDPGLRDSLGSARAGFDPYSEAMNRYGTIEPGMNPSRMVDVPKRMNPYTKVSKYARTLAESESLPDALMENFEQDVVSGLYNYAPKKQQDSLDRAVKTVEAKGWDGALEQWHEVVDGMRECTDDDLILAQVLLSTAAQANDTAAVSNLSAQIAAKGTEAGRMVNALKLLKRTTPEGRLYYIQHVIDKMNSDYSKKGLDTKIEMDPDLAALLLDSEDTESMDDAMDQIYDNIAEQVPNTLTDYLDAWRYFAMLGNPRTHIRNAIGNVIFRGAMGARNVVSAGLQRALIPENQRTRTLTQSKEYMDFAKADLENAMDELTGNKYTDEFGEVRKRQLETLYPKPIQALMNTSTKGMEYMDLVAKKFTYVRDMANFLKARNVDLENIPKGMLEEARNHAVEQAKYSTFQQYSDLAHALSVHEQNGVAGKLLIGGMVPFKRTPINIAKAAVDFSPIGLAKGLNRTVRDVRKGLYTAGESIDQLAAGMTGTGIMVLGYFMAKMGLVSASGDDNDKQAGFDTAQGTQNYALNIPLPNGDTYSYTIDWAAPAAIPLFIGAEFFHSLAERDGEQTAVEVALDSIGKLFEPLLATTMLSGISSSIKSASYSSSNPIYGVLGNVASNYAGQFVPTLLSQIAKTMDPVRRSTFYDANSKVPKTLQQFLQRQGAKIPGLSEKMPEYLDVWGRNDVGSDNVLIRALENFVSPGYVKKLDSSSMESELQRLNDAGYEGMLPSALQKSAKLDGNRMTAEQWMKRQKEQGSTAYEIMKDFMGTQEYQNLTDDQKAKFVDKAYEYAKNSGKAAAGGDTSDFAKWYEAANNAQSEAGLSKERFLSLYAYKSAIEDEAPDEAKASLKQGMWEEYINGLSDLSQEQKDYVLDNVKFWQMMPADSGAYQKAKNAGYDTPEAIQALLEAKSSFSTDGNNDINNTEMYKGIIGQTSDPAEQEKMYNAIKDKDAKKSWKELAAEQSKQQQVESTAQAALDKAVSKDKQTAFATAMENATGTKQTDCYRALTSTGASEAECKAYFAYISAQKGWKKSWEKVKADALKGK